MLQTLRDKTSGWFATVVLGLLIVPFAFVGVQDYFRRTTEQPVATVSAPPAWWGAAPSFWPFSMAWQREDISQQDFRERFEQERQRQRAQDPAQFDARAFDKVDNKRKVLDALIDERVQKLWTSRQGVVVSNEMVRAEIAKIPAFQIDGKFNLQAYRLALRTMQPPRNEAEFERLVREGLAQSLASSTIGSSSFVTPSESARIIALLGERRDVSVVELPAPAPDVAPVSPAEIDTWYRAHQNQFRAPETVSLEYVDLDAATLPAPVVDDTVLRQRYEQEKTRFVAQEQRQASHILIRVAPGGGPAADKAAQAKAAAIAAQARAPGADFAALARANSDDTGSKASGGDLGLISRGVMAAPFEKALFSMQPGQVSDPVKTEFGWHVIQLKQIQQGKQEAFEQARASLTTEYVEAERERVFNAMSSKLVDAILKNPSALAPAAREVGLPVQTAGPIARGQAQGVLANPAVQRAAFAESAIEQGMVSDPIDIGTNHSIVLRVAAHAPARQLTLAEVRDRVVAEIHGDRVRRATAKRAEALVAQVRGGMPLAQVAAAQSLPPPRPMLAIPRGAQVIAPDVSDAFFTAPPSKSGPAAGSQVLPDGRALVFVVDRVQPGTAADAGGQEAALTKQIAQLVGIVDVESLVHSIRKSMHIQVNEANL